MNKKNKQQNVIKSAGAAIHFLGSALNLPQASVEEFRDRGYNQTNSPLAQRLLFAYAKSSHRFAYATTASSGTLLRLGIEECVFPSSSEESSRLRSSPALIT